jgi:hypothetical protein
MITSSTRVFLSDTAGADHGRLPLQPRYRRNGCKQVLVIWTWQVLVKFLAKGSGQIGHCFDSLRTGVEPELKCPLTPEVGGIQ